jgi:hypothetical protein
MRLMSIAIKDEGCDAESSAVADMARLYFMGMDADATTLRHER